ncbi:MAG: inorganic phosphate transporter [Elusimicrobia bacterium]|nr:inorganic phosphate transporter [Elusimicrobiota bacterium]
MDSTLLAVSFLVALALIFDFLNGANDAANSICTIVATKVLKPGQAVVWAAFFNFIAFLVFGTHVAKTMGKGIIDINIVDNIVIFSALIGASSWTAISTYLGFPISVSHSLIGALIGTALIKAGYSALIMSGIYKTALFIVLSPILGMLLGSLFMVILYNAFKKSTPSKVEHIFAKGQLFSAALYSLGHGGNDAQKTMGIIAGLLYSAGYLGGEFHIPLWVVLSAQGAIALGTLIGGWKVVNTLGNRLAKLRPVDGFAAETGAAATLYMATFFGIPVSTTHTITGAILGVGSVKRLHSVRWGVSKEIIWAWVLTIPGSALISALTFYITTKILG